MAAVARPTVLVVHLGPFQANRSVRSVCVDSNPVGSDGGRALLRTQILPDGFMRKVTFFYSQTIKVSFYNPAIKVSFCSPTINPRHHDTLLIKLQPKDTSMDDYGPGTYPTHDHRICISD